MQQKDFYPQVEKLHDTNWRLDKLIADHYSKTEIDAKVTQLAKESEGKYVHNEAFEKANVTITEKIGFVRQQAM